MKRLLGRTACAIVLQSPDMPVAIAPVPPPGGLAIEPSVDDEGSLTITFHNTTFDRWRINDASISVPWRPRCPAKLPPIEIAPYIDLGQNGCSLGA
jgi:hypothetical protein